MRAFLVTAFVAFAVVATGLFFAVRHKIVNRDRRNSVTRTPEEAQGKKPDRVTALLTRVKALQLGPDTEKVLDDFVRECARRGPAAVEELRALLRDEPDLEFKVHWSFEGGQVRGYPTLHSAFLAALLAIPGPESRAALLEALASASAEEAYQIAAGLDRRGEDGFTALALNCAAKAGPGQAEVVRDLAALLARADPDGAASEVVARSPRGEDGSDPVLLAQVIESLPMERVKPLARDLLIEPRVTAQAKARYLQCLCDRGEPEILSTLREIVNEGHLDRELRHTVANKAVVSNAFYADQVAYLAARPGPEGDPRVAIRERYARRLEEAEKLVAAAVPESESAVTRDTLRRRLDEQRSRLP